MTERGTVNPDGKTTLTEEDHLKLNVTGCAVNVVTGDVASGYAISRQSCSINCQDDQAFCAEIRGTAVLAEGEVVTQTIENSDINVVSGNLVQGNNILNVTCNQHFEGGTIIPEMDQWGLNATGSTGSHDSISHQAGPTVFPGTPAFVGDCQELVVPGSRTSMLAEGGVVTQSFENSDIKVIAGDLIQGDKIIHVTYNQTFQGRDRHVEQGARPKRQELAEDAEISSASRKQPMSRKHDNICKVINENAKRITAEKITEDFDCEMLNEPEFKVYPEMVKVRNFFKGGYGQIINEMGFHSGEERHRDGIITLDELLESINMAEKKEDRDRHVVTAIVASAGSGKTTLMKRIARKTLEHSSSASMDEVAKKMIHYIELKHIQYETRLKPAQFLFQGLFKDHADEDEAFNWLYENHSDVILFFDGLDQAAWKVDEKIKRKMRPFEYGNTAEIMYNLLSGNILPHVKIVIASREFSISELPSNARPRETITLVGLKRGDAEKLFISLIGAEGRDIWNKIESMSPRLLLIISVPVFLILTAIIMTRDPSGPPPLTVTQLYNRILLILRHTENIQEREQIIDVIQKLKGMAHQGMEEGRVVFCHSDLKKFGVSMKDIRDLMMKVPGNNILSRHLLEGDFIFFFCHQSLQEFLSASFVAEMWLPEFDSFNDECLHESRWSVVCRFVSGIIHDEVDNKLHNVSDSKSKQNVFLQAIQSRTVGGLQRELLATIYESNNDLLIRSLPSISFNLGDIYEDELSPDEAYMFGSILARREKRRKKT